MAPLPRSTAATRLTKSRLAKAVRPSGANATPATALCVSGAASGTSRRERHLAAMKIKDVHDVVGAAAADELLPVGREREAVKGLMDGNDRSHRVRRQVDDPNLMLAAARVERGGVPSGRIDHQVDREVAQGHLLSDRPDRPLVVQEGRAVGLEAGQDAAGRRGIRPRRAGRGRQGSEREEESQSHGKTIPKRRPAATPIFACAAPGVLGRFPLALVESRRLRDPAMTGPGFRRVWNGGAGPASTFVGEGRVSRGRRASYSPEHQPHSYANSR